VSWCNLRYLFLLLMLLVLVEVVIWLNPYLVCC
jgi:hypothetical protein